MIVDNLTAGTVTYEYSDTVANGNVISQNPTGGTAVPIGSSVDLVVSLGQPEVPNVVGMTEPNAIAAVTAVDNLTVGTVTYEYSDTVTAGLVISQNPVAYTVVPIGSTVDLVISSGQPVVPNVVGMTEADANSAITGAGLTVGNISYEYSDTVPAGHVISQEPVGGLVAPVGYPVDLVVSGVIVPDVVDQPEDDANSAITAAGLTVGGVTYQHSDTLAE
jgi:beta-lactam-binding protein with PASTA domain